MRLFLAIAAEDLAVDPQLALKKLRINLDQKGVEHRWVRPENRHVTICFLGEVEAEATAISSVLETLIAGHGVLKLQIRNLDAFPAPQMGRVIWAQVQNSRALRALQESCQEELSGLGIPVPEREFRPHLTLLRLRSPRDLRDLLSPFKNMEFGTLTVSRVTLFESRLGGTFPLYVPLAHFPLGD